jgi:hypothetical protein
MSGMAGTADEDEANGDPQAAIARTNDAWRRKRETVGASTAERARVASAWILAMRRFVFMGGNVLLPNFRIRSIIMTHLCRKPSATRRPRVHVEILMLPWPRIIPVSSLRLWDCSLAKA